MRKDLHYESVTGNSLQGHPPQGQAMQVPISPTFYRQLFRAKAFCKAFTWIQFGVRNFFLENDTVEKAAHKILLKLTLDVSVAENYSRVPTFAPSTRRRFTTCPPTSTSAPCAASSTVTSNIFSVTLKLLIQVSSMRVTKIE